MTTEDQIFNQLIASLFGRCGSILRECDQVWVTSAHDDPECLTPTVLTALDGRKQGCWKDPLFDQRMMQLGGEARKSALMINRKINT